MSDKNSDDHWSDELVANDEKESPYNGEKGAGMGALAGIAVGIAAGSAIGPPGAVFGAVAGGLIGAVAGEVTAESMAIVENDDILPGSEAATDPHASPPHE